MDNLHRHQEIIDPDGYTSTVLLCAGNWVTVERHCAHNHYDKHGKLVIVERYKSFPKSQINATQTQSKA